MLLANLFFLIAAVSGTETDEVKPVSVIEGDSVTLPTNLTELQNDDTILWMFGPKDSLIAQIKRKTDLTSQLVPDYMGFSSRLQLDQKTGSITIRNTRIRHSGKYKLIISREQTTIKIFNVTVLDVVGKRDGIISKSVSVTEGEPFTLHIEGEIAKDALILWRFGDQGVLLAKVDIEANDSSINNADDDKFRGRLKVDHQTGSLTITNTKTTDSDFYELQIRGIESLQRFFVSVSARPGLSVGAIAGILCGVFFLFLAVGVVMYYMIYKSKDQTAEETKSVMEGDSLELQMPLTTEIHNNDAIEWWYEVEDNLIAEIKGGSCRTSDGADGRFRSKLSLNRRGHLTISNTRTIHSGLYILKISISNKKPTSKRFIVTISVKSVPKQEGETVIFPAEAQIQRDDLVLWTFGAENCLVVRAISGTTSFTDRFRGRVELDGPTASLTIKDIIKEDSGHFKLQIINSERTRFRRFNLNVTASTGNQVSATPTVLTPLRGGDIPDGESQEEETHSF